MHDKYSDRPLVTFALFAYNQEKFIREAIEGAFAQTYEPLEIILSDDCSSDQTFDIMLEMAAAYRGPHDVRVSRNKKNLGVIPHVEHRCREAKGEYIIVAAGDDISRPNRTAVLVDQFKKTGAWAIATNFDLIDDRGQIIAKNVQIRSTTWMAECFHTSLQRPYRQLQGSTSAYARRVFTLSTDFKPQCRAEDNWYNIVIYANGGFVVQHNASLIEYRQHSDALSNNNRIVSSFEQEESESLRVISLRLDIVETIQKYMARRNVEEFINHKKLDQIMSILRIKQMWTNLSVSMRSRFVCASFFQLKLRETDWMARRLLGTHPRYHPLVEIKFLRSIFVGRNKLLS